MLKRYLIHPKIECLFTEDEFVLLCEKLLLELVSVDHEGYINAIVILSDILEADIFIDCSAQALDHALIANLKSSEKAYFSPKEFIAKLKRCVPYPMVSLEINE